LEAADKIPLPVFENLKYFHIDELLFKQAHKQYYQNCRFLSPCNVVLYERPTK